MNNISITNKIMNGAIWSLIQTILLKVISFGSQILLAWILLPNDFGKIALVYTITNISSLMQQFGLQDVLIKRGNSFKLWLPLSFGMITSVAFLSVIIAIIAGYFGGYFYDDYDIFYLVAIFSISMPFQALSIIPDTFLKINLKFKQISIIKIFEVFLIQLGTIIFALLNFGVMSFVLPMVIVAILRCAYLFYYTKLNLIIPSLKKWKYLTYNSIQGLFFAIFSRLSMQVDVMILGVISSQAIVGVYFMGMTLSTQVIGLLGVTLPTVLFPALMSYAGKDLNQVKVPLQKVIIFMSLIGVPFACWQAVNAKPLITLFLSEKWIPSIIFVQILSIGMVFRLISSSWVVPLKLNGDFKEMSNVTFISLIQLLIIIIPLAYFFEEYGVAIGVSLFYLVNTPYLIYKGFKSYNINYNFIVMNCLKIILISFVSFGTTFYLSETIYVFQNSSFYNLIINTFLSTLIYILLVNIFMKDFLVELLFKIKNYKR